ncbi:hypothetical protein BurJ1DRAFT_4842 [Burkholderiales bacterium JOSHI_001]|nr:hypothetical protein BurJ1DRAFT_4842 [Burkholderiales bacterium JOSHI_001]
MSEADVHQLVGFLAAYDPGALAQLQQTHPDQAWLRPGRTLGRLAAPAALRVELAAQSLAAMVAQGDALADRLARRIRTSHRVELLAQLVALGGSGGVLAALWSESSPQFKLAAAALGVLGSATAVAVKFLRRDLGGAENGLIAQHAALVKAVAQGVETAQRLQPHQRSRDDLGDPAALSGLLDQANTLAGQMYLLMKQVGAPMPGLQAGKM